MLPRWRSRVGLDINLKTGLKVNDIWIFCGHCDGSVVSESAQLHIWWPNFRKIAANNTLDPGSRDQRTARYRTPMPRDRKMHTRPVGSWIPAWKIVLSIFLEPFWKWFNEITGHTNIMVICHCNQIFQTLHNPIFIIIWWNFENIISQKSFQSFLRLSKIGQLNRKRYRPNGSWTDKPEVELSDRKLKLLKTFLSMIFFISSSLSSAKWLITFRTEQT